MKEIKINLGCGKKKLKGWVNVDKVDRGQEVVSDIRLLPFPSGHADVIMSVHVVEHFVQWEVFHVLCEWVRVLKPGGLLITECPSLVKAIDWWNKQNIRSVMYDVDSSDKALDAIIDRKFLWPLYGNHGHKDHLMTHRYGYTPATLARLLRSVGLINIVDKPPEYHDPERDMRIEASKPA